MSLIDDIKRDSEAGTPGPWVFEPATDKLSDGDKVRGGDGFSVCCNTDFYPTAVLVDDMKRIARVPTLENQVLRDAEIKAAAEELAEAAGLLRERLLSFELTGDGDQMCRDFIEHVEPAEDRMAAALSAYRKATEGEG